MQFQEVSTVFTILAGVGVLAAGIGFAYAQFKSGSSKAKDDLIETIQKRLDAEKERSANLQVQINELSQKLGKLEGLYEAESKKNSELVTILQGRDPENKKFMEFLSGVAKQAAEYMATTSPLLVEIRDTTSANNKKLDGSKITKTKTTIQQIEPKT